MFISFKPTYIGAASKAFELFKTFPRIFINKSSKKLFFNKFHGYATVLKNEINILGIETSCDDTGSAIVNGSGEVLGEGYYSQVETSVKFGGVVPSVAKKYHEKHIKKVVDKAFEESGLSPKNITAVATTVKPGNTHSLEVGYGFGKQFALLHGVPFIPIHHMEAHALTIRMKEKVDFPFLVLLVSGGHCVLTLTHSIDEWSIIGETIDVSPGCVIDQVARRLKLKNVPELHGMSGGRAIQTLAEGGDPTKYPFPSPMAKYRDSNFSFSGIHTYAKELIGRLENETGTEGGRVLEEAKDICSAFQLSIVKHLVRRTHRGMRFVETTGRIPEGNKALVISGGVASNSFLRQAFEALCKHEEYRLFIPPPKLCTDNGIMVAWNGVERWLAGKGILYTEEEIKNVKVEHKCPLGPNISKEHQDLNLSNPTWVKI